MGIFDLSVVMDYVEGIDYYSQGDPIRIILDKKSNILTFKPFMAKHLPTINLDLESIEVVDFTKEIEIEQKSKSVIGRAALGTLLLGPFGGIIGGISGVGNKQKREKRVILTIGYKGKDIHFIQKDQGEVMNMAYTLRDMINKRPKPMGGTINL